MILPRNGLLAANNNGMTFKQNDCSPNDCWYVSKVNINGASTERQRFQFDLFGNLRVALSNQSKQELLVGIRCETASDMLVTPFEK
jgi:hypothetical protein